MKLKAIGLVILSFIVSLFIFLPYAKLYNYLIFKTLKANHIHASYQIEKASLLKVVLKNVKLKIDSQNIGMKRVRVAINPLILVSSRAATLDLDNGEAKINILKKSNSFRNFIIKGFFYSRVLSKLLSEPLKSMLSNFSGKNSLVAKIRITKNDLIIDDLSVSGSFNLKIRGYISPNRVELRGYVKIGKVKHEFVI